MSRLALSWLAVSSGDRREAIADLDAFLTDFLIDIAPIDDRMAARR